MVSEDDQADPKVGTTVAQKLVDAKVAAVVGHLNSGVTIPASEIYNKAGIPVISGSATNPTLTERGLKNTFRTVGRDDQQGPAIAAYIAGELKGKKVAIIDDKTAYGEGIANEVEKTLKAAKVNIVGRERTTDKETDFKAILTKIKGKNPDVDLPRRHGRHRRPDAQAGARARHQGRVRVRRRRLHRRDEQARRPRGRGHGVLAGGPARARRPARSSRTPSRRSTARSSSTRPTSTTAPWPIDRGDEEGRFRSIRRSSCRS